MCGLLSITLTISLHSMDSMAKDFKDVEVFQISVMITNAKQGGRGSRLSLAGQEAFLSVPSRVDKSTVE